MFSEQSAASVFHSEAEGNRLLSNVGTFQFNYASSHPRSSQPQINVPFNLLKPSGFFTFHQV